MIKNNGEITKGNLEAPGFEPGAFRMRSGHSTTELCPLGVEEGQNLKQNHLSGFLFCPKRFTAELNFNILDQKNEHFKHRHDAFYRKKH